MLRRSDAVTAAAATAVTVACVLPAFLTGGMVVQLREDLSLGVAEVGLAMSAFVGVQALCSRNFGRQVDLIGAVPSLRIATAIAFAAALLAAGVREIIGLTVALSLSGAANALGQPAASRMIARSVGHHRQGFVFGMFQSSKPIAGLIGGLAVPAVALTVGWRWAFAGSAAGALVLQLLLVRLGSDQMHVAGRSPRAVRPRLDRGVRMPLLIGAALGFGAVKVFGTFVVDGGVDAGLRPATAGLVLSACSALAVASRLTVGAVADRRTGSQLGVAAGMLGLGSLGFLLMASLRPAPLIIGALLVAAGAWGYNGLFYLSMTRLLSAAPGAITGLVLSSASVGGVVAPLAFGVVVDRWSYALGWLVTSLWGLLAAAAMWRAHRLAGPATRLPSGAGDTLSRTHTEYPMQQYTRRNRR